ncbi:reverse transcriptase domain-containing protein [Tanacetum coccineum]
MSVRLADRSFQYPVGIAKNMLVEVGKFTFPADFVILEIEEDSKVPLILGRPFLHTADAVIRVKQKQLNLGVGTERMIFNIDSAMKQSYSNDDTCFSVDVIDEILEEPSFLPIIIPSQLSQEKNKLVSILKKYKQAFAWKITDIPGIWPLFCKHKIQLLDDKKPVVQKQRSPWVSLIHCVPKKGGITVVTNENNELVPTRTVTGWRVCINYRKLNEATTKDHFPLPFMDQMLERLAGNKYFCFLDGFSGYFQIPIDPNDQEKTTFTCPFRTYAYRRMPFGLCNAPDTFQRCMLAIFHDMIEESIEVFMDDFFVFGNSFDTCLNNLDKMLQRCKDAHLVLNWEKCHFMVKEGIVLGHKVSSAGLEVDKAKIDVISKLPPPTNIKDYVSKWAEAQALPTNDARVVVAFLKKLFCHFGMPEALISDQGTYFFNKIMEKTMKRYGFNHRFSTSYHPQTSGQVENTISSIKEFLKNCKDNPAIYGSKKT